MKCAFIEEQKTQHAVRGMCRFLNVCAAGYYEWRRCPPSARVQSDGELQTAIGSIHAAS